jgi:hypothetical protein
MQNAKFALNPVVLPSVTENRRGRAGKLGADRIMKRTSNPRTTLIAKKNGVEANVA